MELQDIIKNITLLNIISHRTNSVDPLCTDYLFEVSSDEPITDGFYALSENQNVEGKILYNVWLKDNLYICDYALYLQTRDYLQETTDRILARKIYRYCCEKDIKIIYAYTHKQSTTRLAPIFSEEEFDVISRTFQTNYQKQLDSLNYMAKLFPDHKIIRSFCDVNDDYDDDYDTRCLSITMTIMKKGDCFFTFDAKNQQMEGASIVLMTRRFENLPTTPAQRRNIISNSGILSLEELKILTKNYITILDKDFYNKKITIDTLVLATHSRVSKNSSLNVLPRHLLRQIGMWF